MHKQPVYKLISKDTAELIEPYRTTWGDWIPAGFHFDGMTFNRVVGLPKFGNSVDVAAIEHDFVYIYEGLLPSGRKFTRLQSDVRLMATLIKYGNNEYKSELAYRLVRIFGSLLWRNNSTKL